MGIKIIGVKIVGLCSKCAKNDGERIKDSKGVYAKDKEISCVNEAFGDCPLRNSEEVRT